MSTLPSQFPASDAAKTRVAAMLREQILAGTLRFGEALPSERTLSEQLGVGRTVVRQALAELDDEGLLERKGTRVRTVVFDRGDDHPTWLKKSVAILTPRRLTGGPAPTRTRWLQYTTLRTIDHLRDRDIHAITLSLGAIDDRDLQKLARSKPLGILIPELGIDQRALLQLADLFREAGVPVVCYGGSPALANFDRVTSDHEGGTSQLVKALLAKGCRSILRFWPRPWETYWFEARSRSYTRLLEQASLKVHPIIEFPYTPAPLEDRAKFDYAVRQVAGFLIGPLRQYRPNALLLSTDRDVPYAAAALRLHGIEPGRDIFLAGYDNYWPHCEEQALELTAPDFTVDKCNDKAGAEMVRLLFDRINQLLPPEPQTRIVDQELIRAAPPAMFATGS